MGLRILVETPLPVLLHRRPAFDRGPELRERRLGKVEAALRVPTEGTFGERDLVGTERGAVRIGTALLVGRAVADGGTDDHQRRSPGVGDGFAQRDVERREIGVAIVDAQHLPTVRREPTTDVLGERQRGGTVERYVVAVVEANQFPEPQVAGERCRLGRHAFHEIPVGHQRVGSMVDDGVARTIETVRERTLGDRHAHSVGDALAERARRGLDSRRHERLGMSRRAALPLTERSQVVEGEVVSGQVQEAIEQHAAVTRREYEAVAVGPLGIPRIVSQVLVPEDVRHRGGAHRQAGMAGVGLLHRVDRQHPDGVDAQLLDGCLGGRHGLFVSFDPTRHASPASRPRSSCIWTGRAAQRPDAVAADSATGSGTTLASCRANISGSVVGRAQTPRSHT